MKFCHYLYLLTFFFFNYASYSQITLSKRAQYSQLAGSEDKKLFLVEFWATWCAPCINVSKYLNVVQEKYAKDLYVVSVSQEPYDVVEAFLKRHTTKLAVSLDYDGENFKKYKVNALPYGVLLNADGQVVWSGNPSNLKNHHIESFLRKNKKTIPIYDFLKYSQYESETPVEINLQGDFSISESPTPKQEVPIIEQLTPEIISINGDLKQILAFLLNVASFQVEISKEKNQTYQLLYKNTKNKEDILSFVEKKFLLKRNQTKKNGDIFQATLISYNKLWDKNQIAWGDNSPKYLIDDNQISMDNFSVKEALAITAELHKIPIVLLNNPIYINHSPYDWQIHYHFKDLLINNLQDLDFKITQTKGDFDFYTFF